MISTLVVRVEVAGRLVGEDAAAARSTSARAIATRCCWPPESWFGWWSEPVAEADALERRLGARAPLARRTTPA